MSPDPTVAPRKKARREFEVFCSGELVGGIFADSRKEALMELWRATFKGEFPAGSRLDVQPNEELS
jgi:hypothetical protein